MVEQGTENPRVGSSILSLGTIFRGQTCVWPLFLHLMHCARGRDKAYVQRFVRALFAFSDVRNLKDKDCMLNFKYLEELEKYMKSGNMEEDFTWSAEERRQEMLEFLDKLMDLGELADQTATSIIFKGSALGALMGMPKRDDRT